MTPVIARIYTLHLEMSMMSRGVWRIVRQLPNSCPVSRREVEECRLYIYKAGFAPSGAGAPGTMNYPLVSMFLHSILSRILAYLILRPLRHQLLPLLLHNHLLLAIRQRPRYTQQQRTCADNPQCLAAQRETGLEP
jgi:hypothetical protein